MKKGFLIKSRIIYPICLPKSINAIFSVVVKFLICSSFRLCKYRLTKKGEEGRKYIIFIPKKKEGGRNERTTKGEEEMCVPKAL